ncbi:histone-lysine N-methyltransferase SETMAR [Trichonephila clavipes]|nr:histone-lysine N-methyltransferase SETMAR [Trichonephila clavipes]
MKLPVRRINTTNKRRLVQGHETPLRLFYEENREMFLVPGKTSLYRKIRNIEVRQHFIQCSLASKEASVCLVSENASQVAEIRNSAHCADTVTANCVQFWFRRFRSGIFDVKDAPRTGKPVVENIDKITEIINVDR